MDSFYIIAVLTKQLLTHKTHITGTLRFNRRNIPKEVI